MSTPITPARTTEKFTLAAAIANAAAVALLITLSFVIYEYERILEPLYATAPVQYHLNKVIWSACILGSLAPTLPSSSLLVVGILITLLPTSAYWVAAYTGRYHDVIWGPVATHLLVLAPVIYLGVTTAKGLRESHEDTATTGAVTLPMWGMALTSLRELWNAITYIRELDETNTLNLIGSFAIALWLVSPFLSEQIKPTASAPVVEPEKTTTPSPPLNKKERKQQAKAEAASKKAASAANTVPLERKETPKQSDLAKKHAWRITILPIIPLLITFGKPPTLPKPLHEPFTHPSTPLRVLSSVHSPYSNVVLVGEVLPPVEASNIREPHSIRYLRAGHSLLGGVWIGNRVYRKDGLGPVQVDRYGTPLGDSIYGTFVLQEAVRLVDVPDADSQKNALIIGLGTGISASAFIQHSISTTVVEIDPAVYDAAERFFALPEIDDGHLFLEDARGWVHKRRQQLAGSEATTDATTKTDLVPLFDYVVHDCFSGGGVPGHIFTLQFWNELKAIMKPSGVIAVNFAGKLDSSSSRGIATTLKKAFTQCRVFHDSVEELSEEQLRTDFINWVFFCTPSSQPLAFRPPIEGDYLNSYLREKYLSALHKHEIPFDRFTRGLKENEEEKYILTEVHNPLGDWQKQDALHHWGVMRQVLTDVFWETY